MGAIEELVAFVNSEWRGGDHKRRADVLVAAVNAELAAGEERVVYVTPGVGITNVSDGGPIQSLSNDAARCIFGDVPDGTHAFAIRPLPDALEPAVRPWLIRPNAAQPYLVCRYCQWRAEVGAVACGECGKPFLEPEELPEPVVEGGA